MSNNRSLRLLVCIVTTLACAIAGCRLSGVRNGKVGEEPMVCEPPATREIEVPQVCEPVSAVAATLPEPLTINTEVPPEDWFLTLQEAVQITLANSDVIRNLGGLVVTGSVYDVAVQELGVEAALSDFDARVTSGIVFNRDERSFNNLFFGGGATSVNSNTANYQLEVTKRGATGTQYSIRNLTGYDRNSSPASLFRSAYDTAMEAELRQPLLRGAGIGVNRIAGPNGGPGVYNGVVLARVRTDIALADFEVAVRNLVRDVEASYWNLYFAYRSLDARTAAYEAALASWRTVQDQFEAGTADGEKEALARTAFYRTKAAMRNALGGSVDGEVGVHSAERALRLLMGIAANDGRLIRPSDEPSVAKRIFDWQDSVDLALDRRAELRRQRWVVKQRESELLASKNYLLSQLDLVGLYRWRGFGDDLLGNRDVLNGSAVSDLWTGDLQGWQLGLQYSTTLGKRREHVAVRAAELQLARERALLRNQELVIGNNLSSQFAEMDRSYEVSRDNFNRAIAERQRLNYAQAKFDVGEELLEFVLEAQQTTADADSQYYRTLVDYNVAVANMHVSRGTYLDYMGVRLSEGPWSNGAYESYRKEFRRFKPRMNYCKMVPPAMSAGAFSQIAPVSQGVVSDTDYPTIAPVPEVLGAEPSASAGVVHLDDVIQDDTLQLVPSL